MEDDTQKKKTWLRKSSGLDDKFSLQKKED